MLLSCTLYLPFFFLVCRDDVMHHIYKFIEMCALSKFMRLNKRVLYIFTFFFSFFFSAVGMAGSSDYFLNSSGYVYGYIALKAVLVIEYSVGKLYIFV